MDIGIEDIINIYYKKHAGEKYTPMLLIEDYLLQCGKYYRDWGYYFKIDIVGPRQIASKNNRYNDMIDVEIVFRKDSSKTLWEKLFKKKCIDDLTENILNNNFNKEFIELFKIFINKNLKREVE